MNISEDVLIQKIRFVDFLSSLDKAGLKDFASFHPYLNEANFNDRELLRLWIDRDSEVFSRLELDLCTSLRKMDKKILFFLKTQELFLFCVVVCLVINNNVL